MLEDLSKRVAERLKPKWGENIPWDQIFELILVLVDRCFSDPTVAVEAAKATRTVRELSAMNVIVRNVLGVHRRAAVIDVRDTVLGELAVMTPEDLCVCHHEACEALGYA